MCQSPPKKRLISYLGQFRWSWRGLGLGTHCDSEGPDVCGWAPSEIQLRLGTSEYCCTDRMSFLKWIRVWIKWLHIAAVSQGNPAEAFPVLAVINQNIIGLNVCFALSI